MENRRVGRGFACFQTFVLRISVWYYVYYRFFLIWKSFCIMFSIVLRFEVSTKWKTLFIFCGFNRFNYQYIENL